MSQLKAEIPGEEQPMRINSKSIFGDRKMVIIEHEDLLYRLMITRQGKLILTK